MHSKTLSLKKWEILDLKRIQVANKFVTQHVTQTDTESERLMSIMSS